MWKGVKGLDFKFLHEQVGNEGTDGGTHGCIMYMFMILTLEEDVGVFKAELQEGYYLWDGYVGPLM